MKNFLTTTFILTMFISFSQENKYAEDVLGVKIGLIGGWINYEKALNDNVTINSEIGYEGGFLKGTNNKVDYVFTTIFSLEPRYYYNFEKRHNKEKKTVNNSANYLSSEIFYVSDLLSSTNRDNLGVNQSFGIIPKYGLRRVISGDLSFEFAFGIGYAWGANSINGVASALDLRINLKL